MAIAHIFGLNRKSYCGKGLDPNFVPQNPVFFSKETKTLHSGTFVPHHFHFLLHIRAHSNWSPMAAFEILLSQARRHCFTRTSSTLSSLLRSSNPSFPLFHRSFCSSSPSNPESNSQARPDEESPRRPQPIQLQPVSYPVKPKEESPPNQNPNANQSSVSP